MFPRCERVNLDVPDLRVESRMGVSLGVLGTGPGRVDVQGALTLHLFFSFARLLPPHSTWLASGNNTVCHYNGNTDPPTNYTEWGELIGALGAHMVAKYGEETASEFFFEVWNEPNDKFWSGGEGQPGQAGLTKQSSYWELYKSAALALKAASPKLQVGGPATCCADCWLKDFVYYMDNHSVPYDFISTHVSDPRCHASSVCCIRLRVHALLPPGASSRVLSPSPHRAPSCCPCRRHTQAARWPVLATWTEW